MNLFNVFGDSKSSLLRYSVYRSKLPIILLLSLMFAVSEALTSFMFAICLADLSGAKITYIENIVRRVSPDSSWELGTVYICWATLVIVLISLPISGFYLYRINLIWQEIVVSFTKRFSSLLLKCSYYDFKSLTSSRATTLLTSYSNQIATDYFYPFATFPQPLISVVILASVSMYTAPVVSVSVTMTILMCYLIYNKFTSRHFSGISTRLGSAQIDLFKTTSLSVNAIKDIRASRVENEFLNIYCAYERSFRSTQGLSRFLILSPRFIIQTFTLVSLLSLILIYFLREGNNEEVFVQILFALSLATKILPNLQALFTLNRLIKTTKKTRQAFVEVISNLAHTNVGNDSRLPQRSTLIVKESTPCGAIYRCLACDILIDPNKIVSVKNFGFNQGTTNAIRGASGSGKTTYLDILSGLYKPYSLEHLDEKIKIGYLPQTSFFPEVSVSDYLSTISNHPIGKSEFVNVFSDLGLLNDSLSVDDILNTLLSSTSNRFSGGQLKRIALAKLALSSKDLLILDEPTSGLDQRSELLVLNLLNKMKQNGATIILSTHSDLIYDGCDQRVDIRELLSFKRL